MPTSRENAPSSVHRSSSWMEDESESQSHGDFGSLSQVLERMSIETDNILESIRNDDYSSPTPSKERNPQDLTEEDEEEEEENTGPLKEMKAVKTHSSSLSKLRSENRKQTSVAMKMKPSFDDDDLAGELERLDSVSMELQMSLHGKNEEEATESPLRLPPQLRTMGSDLSRSSQSQKDNSSILQRVAEEVRSEAQELLGKVQGYPQRSEVLPAPQREIRCQIKNRPVPEASCKQYQRKGYSETDAPKFKTVREAASMFGSVRGSTTKLKSGRRESPRIPESVLEETAKTGTDNDPSSVPAETAVVSHGAAATTVYVDLYPQQQQQQKQQVQEGWIMWEVNLEEQKTHWMLVCVAVWGLVLLLVFHGQTQLLDEDGSVNLIPEF